MVKSTKRTSMVLLFKRFTLLLTVEKTKLDLMIGTPPVTLPLTLILIRLLLVSEKSDRMTRQFRFRVLPNGLI